MGSSVVAVLIDAENVNAWGEAALGAILARAAGEGEVRYRRAYGDWARCGRIAPALTRLGFELVQVHHPVARKNSADIHMTVDAMDLLALDAELGAYVLVTGDSDFAPLFRRLRERRCRVIGAGPRSRLSESVVSSCVDYVFVGPRGPVGSAEAQAPVVLEAIAVPVEAASTWRGQLRTWKWPVVTEEALDAVVAIVRAHGRAPKGEHLARFVERNGEEAATAFRSVWTVLGKARVLVGGGPEGHALAEGPEPVADRIDAAFLGRVRRGMAEHGLAWDDHLLRWIVGGRDPERLARLAAESEGAGADERPDEDERADERAGEDERAGAGERAGEDAGEDESESELAASA